MRDAVFISLNSLTRREGVLTYPSSPDYRPDIDALPPVQVSLRSFVSDGLILMIP